MNNKSHEFNNIEIVISDFDGIFTDGTLEVFSDGRTSKKINYKDIMAVSILLKNNIKFAVVSGETSCAIDVLKSKFPQIIAYQNERNKLNIVKNILNNFNINPLNVLYIGDDINDSECLQYVGHPATVKDAHYKIKNIPNIFITNAKGGQGAFREITDLIV